MRAGWWILAIIVFGLVIAIRIRLLGIPLERDEGEYAYAGQLILQGIPPYKLAYNMKFPRHLCSLRRNHVDLWTNNNRNSFGTALGQCSYDRLDLFAGPPTCEFVVGLTAANELCRALCESLRAGVCRPRHTFCVAPVLGGTLLLLKPETDKLFGRLFTSGLLFGIGLLMKQPAVFFALFGAIYLVSRQSSPPTHALKKILLRNLIF